MQQNPSAGKDVEPIAIVGMECIFPGAENLAAFWSNIVRGIDSTGEVPASRWRPRDYGFSTTRGGFIEEPVAFDPLPYGIMPAEVAAGDPEQFIVLSVVNGALLDADEKGFTGKLSPAAADRTEIVIGRGGYISNGTEQMFTQMEVVDQVTRILERIGGNGSEEGIAELRRRLIESLPQVTPETVACALPNIAASRAANRLNIMGRNFTVDAACASSLIAVDSVVQSLRSRHCDVGVAAGVHFIQKPHFWLGFQALKLLSPSGRCRPFSADADGLLVGEGVGAVVLKRASDAQRDGDRIYAFIRGVGVASDGRGTGLLTPRHEGQVLALRRAYESARIDPSSVTFVEAHGTATAAGDATEIATLHEVFGMDGPPAALGSVKSMIGHTMPAAGIAGLIKTALALYHRVLPPTLHAAEVHPQLRESRFVLNKKAIPWISPYNVRRRGGVNAFGFGGVNAHVALEEAPADKNWRSMTPQSSELVLLAAESRTHLAAKLQEWNRLVSTLKETDLLAFAARAAGEIKGPDPFRIAMIVTSTKDLAEKIRRVESRLADGKEENWQDEDGVYVGVSSDPNRVAFLLPGIEMPGAAGDCSARVAELCIHFPAVRQEVEKAEDLLKEEDLSYTPSQREYASRVLGDDLTLRAVADMATAKLTEYVGLRPDAVAGFSRGERAAHVAAGLLDLNDLDAEMLEAVRTLFEEGPQTGDGQVAQWGMVAASPEHVSSVLRRFEGDVELTVDVSPKLAFIGGQSHAVREAVALFRSSGAWAQALPIHPSVEGYLRSHTRMAGVFQEQWRSLLSTIPFQTPRCPIYCPHTARPFPDDLEQVRDLLAESLTRPVRIRDVVAQLYKDGTRIFVQLGSGGKLLPAIQHILGDQPYVALSIDLQHRGGLEQLHHFLGRMFTLGIPFQFDSLYRNRAYRELDSTEPTALHRGASHQLFLSPPRLRPSDDTIEWIRDYLKVSPLLTSSSIKPGAVPSSSKKPTGPLGSIQETMDRFLQIQQKAEEQEAAVLGGLLEGIQTAIAGQISNTGRNDAAYAKETASFSDAEKYPLLGTVLRLTPGEELMARLVLDLTKYRFLGAHTMLTVPKNLKTAEELLPTLPMTFAMEILAEAATALMPGLTVIACHDIEAKRWISLEDETTLTVSIIARRVAESTVEAELRPDGHSSFALRGRVTLAPSRPQPPRISIPRYETSCPHTAEEYYRNGPLFHGVLFHKIKKFLGMSPDSVGAELLASDPDEYLSQPASGTPILDPVLLDAACQIVAYQAWLGGKKVVSLALGNLYLYGHHPAAGSTLRADVRYRILDPRQVEADIDIYDSEGGLYARIEGFKDWRCSWPGSLTEANTESWKNPVGSPVEIGKESVSLYRVQLSALGDMSPDWAARVYLNTEERKQYNKNHRQDWLLGRIAAKDAIRDLLKRHRGIELHPLEIEITNDPNGAPIVCRPVDEPIVVSIAHIEEEALAVASTGGKVGVDLVLISKREKGFPELAFSIEERDLLSMDGDEALVWMHRIWCAKEATAKAFAKGLAELGQFPVRAINSQKGLVSIECLQDGATVHSKTWVDGGLAMALTIIE